MTDKFSAMVKKKGRITAPFQKNILAAFLLMTVLS
jgi:hypothetical protein